MSPEEMGKRIAEIEQKLDAIYVSTEKTRKYFLYTLIGSVALFVLPLIGFAFAIPSFLSSYGALNDSANFSDFSATSAELQELLAP